MTDMLFVNFQARIATVEEDRMLNYVMILALEDGLSLPALMSRHGRPLQDVPHPGRRARRFSPSDTPTRRSSAFGNIWCWRRCSRPKPRGSPSKRRRGSWWRSTSTIPRSGISDLYLDDPAAKRMLARAKKLGVAGAVHRLPGSDGGCREGLERHPGGRGPAGRHGRNHDGPGIHAGSDLGESSR